MMQTHWMKPHRRRNGPPPPPLSDGRSGSSRSGRGGIAGCPRRLGGPATAQGQYNRIRGGYSPHALLVKCACTVTRNARMLQASETGKLVERATDLGIPFVPLLGVYGDEYWPTDALGLVRFRVERSLSDIVIGLGWDAPSHSERLRGALDELAVDVVLNISGCPPTRESSRFLSDARNEVNIMWCVVPDWQESGPDSSDADCSDWSAGTFGQLATWQLLPPSIQSGPTHPRGSFVGS